MKKIKKFLFVIVILLSLVLFTGCGNENLSMSCDEIINTLYDGISSDDMPKVGSVELNKDNMESYLGGVYEIESGVASEAMITSIAHSVVVVKVKSGEDVSKIADEIEKKAEEELFRKWICVEADEVEVETRGNTIILIMTNKDLGKQIENNLDKLK